MQPAAGKTRSGARSVSVKHGRNAAATAAQGTENSGATHANVSPLTEQECPSTPPVTNSGTVDETMTNSSAASSLYSRALASSTPLQLGIETLSPEAVAAMVQRSAEKAAATPKPPRRSVSARLNAAGSTKSELSMEVILQCFQMLAKKLAVDGLEEHVAGLLAVPSAVGKMSEPPSKPGVGCTTAGTSPVKNTTVGTTVGTPSVKHPTVGTPSVRKPDPKPAGTAMDGSTATTTGTGSGSNTLGGPSADVEVLKFIPASADHEAEYEHLAALNKEVSSSAAAIPAASSAAPSGTAKDTAPINLNSYSVLMGLGPSFYADGTLHFTGKQLTHEGPPHNNPLHPSALIPATGRDSDGRPLITPADMRSWFTGRRAQIARRPDSARYHVGFFVPDNCKQQITAMVGDDIFNKENKEIYPKLLFYALFKEPAEQVLKKHVTRYNRNAAARLDDIKPQLMAMRSQLTTVVPFIVDPGTVSPLSFIKYLFPIHLHAHIEGEIFTYCSVDPTSPAGLQLKLVFIVAMIDSIIKYMDAISNYEVKYSSGALDGLITPSQSQRQLELLWCATPESLASASTYSSNAAGGGSGGSGGGSGSGGGRSGGRNNRRNGRGNRNSNSGQANSSNSNNSGGHSSSGGNDGSSKSSKECTYCNKRGHTAAECYRKRDDDQRASTSGAATTASKSGSGNAASGGNAPTSTAARGTQPAARPQAATGGSSSNTGGANHRGATVLRVHTATVHEDHEAPTNAAGSGHAAAPYNDSSIFARVDTEEY